MRSTADASPSRHDRRAAPRACVRAMSYQWDFGVVMDSLPLLLHGLGISFLLAVAAMVGGSALGLGVAVLRIRRLPILTGVAAAYVELFRNTPIIAQLLWIYYVLPVVTGIRIPAMESAIIAFSLNVGAFMAEIFRAGILSVPRGQWEAAVAIGLTPLQAFRRVTMPQALRNILPATASIWLSLVKDSSVASVISLGEMMYEARALAVNTYRPVEVLTVAGGLYFIVVYLQSTVIELVYARSLKRSRRGSGEAG
jgi:polar amino acid transport system permease protein